MIRKFAAAAVLDAAIARDSTTFVKDAHRHSFDYVPKPGFLYVRSRAISSRTNDNWDAFPAEEIKRSYATFIGKPVFVNHHNDNHRRARGVIVDAALHEDLNPDGSPDTWAEVLMEVDAVKFPKLAQAIIAGEIERTSMGCDVEYSICTVCGNKAHTPLEYCAHIPAMKGHRIRRRAGGIRGPQEDVLVAEVCYGLGFFENSLLVEPPADPTAYFLGVDTRGLAMTAKKQKSSDDEYVAPSTTQNPSRYDGVTIRRDKDGYYVHTHRARSDSFGSPEAIPDKDVKFIESTGARHATTSDQFNTDRANEDYDPSTKPVDHAETGDGFADLDRLNGDLLEQAERGRARVRDTGHAGSLAPITDDFGMPRHLAYDDDSVSVPAEVDTLRQVKCPAGFAEGDDTCGFSGDQCVLCGYVQPPEQFDDPDTTKAKEFDRDQEVVDDEDEEPEQENKNMGNPAATATRRASSEPRPTPTQQVMALRNAMIERDREVREFLASRDREHTAALAQRDDMIRRQAAIIDATNRRVASLGHAVEFLAGRTGQTAALQSHLGMRRQADAANPAQPVPSPAPEAPTATTEGERNSATDADLFAPGGVPGAMDVAPAAVTDASVIDGSTVADAPADVVDVNAPVAGTGAGEVPLDEVRTEVDVVATPIAPVQNFASRSIACVRLARLRIDAGVDDTGQDDLVAANAIEQSNITNEAIAAEIGTLAKVTASMSRTQTRTAGMRNLVPKLASGEGVRSVPSLVSEGAAITPGPFDNMRVTEDEIAFAG